MFGHQFVNCVMKPAIEAELTKIEQNLIKQEYRNQFSPALISVYLGLLISDNKDEENVKNIIKRYQTSPCFRCAFAFLTISIVDFCECCVLVSFDMDLPSGGAYVVECVLYRQLLSVCR